MTAEQLASACLSVANDYKTRYLWGVFGSPITEEVLQKKAEQYPNWYTATRLRQLQPYAGNGYFGFDCVNLIKGILWGWDGDWSATYGGARYGANGVPDVGANRMIELCEEVSGDFSQIEVGEALWQRDHIGVYVGGGLAVESTPSWKNGVQITHVSGLEGDGTYPSRRWTKHGKLPWVDYAPKPHWAEEYYENLKEMGLVQGAPAFEQKASRGEIFALLSRMLSRGL